MKITVVWAIIFALYAAALFPLTAGGQAAPAPTPPASTFEQRLAQRKNERNVRLDDRTSKRIANVCVRAQGKVRALQQQATPALNNRDRMYQQIDAKVWVAIGKLKIIGMDTFKLEKQRVTFTEKASAFQTTSKLYQQALDDLVVVKCQADTAGFKALLDTARIYRGQLRDQSTDINSFVVNEIKPSLSDFSSELKVKQATEEGS